MKEKLTSIGKDELYCEWFKCPKCSESNIAEFFNYCPDCGYDVRHYSKSK